MAEHRRTRWVWIVGIAVLTLLSFSQSLMNSQHSAQESARVQSLLRQLLGDGVMGSFLYRWIRKVAHFTEYAVLGGAWGGYDRRFRPSRWWAWGAGPVTASIDECLQFLSPGRAPQVWDVLLDCAGYICGMALVWLLVWLFTRRKKRAKQRASGSVSVRR